MYTARRVGRSLTQACLYRYALIAAGLLACIPFASADDASSTSRAVAHPEQWPAGQWPFPADAELDGRVQALLATLSIEEKVGQIIQGDISSVTPKDLRKYPLGSVLAGGNSDPHGNYRATPAQWLALADAFHAEATTTWNGRAGIPILFGIDAVHGHNNLVGATLFPHNIGLGATRNIELIRKIAEATAIEARVTGMDWTFAPTLAVPRDDRWGRAYEGYSESPAIIESYAAAVVEGLQGKVGSPEFLDARHVLASAKHFLADGGTVDGKDQGDAEIDEVTLRDVHGAGYPPAIAAGAQTAMASFSSWQGVKLTGNRSLLTGVLKERLDFGGFVVGDWNAHGQIPGCTNESCVQAVNAGLDMFMAPDSWRGLFDNTLKQVQSGELAMDVLDAAVTRILRVKLRLGLLDAPKPSQRELSGKVALLSSTEHRAIARQAVRESLVLLKNHGALLPLDPSADILIAGDGADNMSKQSGGWTLTWQGTGVENADFPNAQSIGAGLIEQIEKAGGTATLVVDGRYTKQPDAAIVVIGEDPYAEFQGDVADLRYRPDDDRDLELIKQLTAARIPTVVVFLSGRPLWVNRELNAADAFVAAWLPGSEGGGVADVLLRGADKKVQHDFAGKLSFSWPKLATQYDLNVGQAGYGQPPNDPLFPFGFGLTYADDGALAELSEVSGIDAAAAPGRKWLVRGVAGAGFTAELSAKGAAKQALTERADSPSAMQVMSVDAAAQEDARRFRWPGGGEVKLSLRSDQPINLDRETNGDVLLMMTLRVDQPAEADLLVDCGEGCAARLPLGAWLKTLPASEWKRVGFPLKCLRDAGADMSQLRVPFAIVSSQTLDLSLSAVGIGTDVELVTACPPR